MVFGFFFLCIVLFLVKGLSGIFMDGIENFNHCISMNICSATAKCVYENVQNVITNENQILSPQTNFSYVAHTKRTPFTNDILRGKEMFNFSTKQEMNIPSELWNQFYDNENMRFYHYHYLTKMGVNFLPTLNKIQIRRFFKLLTANRYSDQIIPLISQMLQCEDIYVINKKKNILTSLIHHHHWRPQNICFKRAKLTVTKNISILSNVELVAFINKVTEKQLTYVPMTVEAFEIQMNVCE
jgi:hypothetical protein